MYSGINDTPDQRYRFISNALRFRVKQGGGINA